MEQKKIITDKNKLLTRTESVLHYVRINPKEEEYMKVWVKEPTFMQLEAAQMKMFNVNMAEKDVSFDMTEVYRYLFDAFVEKTEPSLNAIDLLRLNPYAGAQLKSVLPDPFSMLEVSPDLKANSEEQ
tara:strand:- start:1119 stop:1499 length:381 start_codon:yes stop_codon:yes gene_type:complete